LILQFGITVLVFLDRPLRPGEPNPFQEFLNIPRSLASDELETIVFDSLDHRMSRVHDFSGPLELEFSEGDTSPSGDTPDVSPVYGAIPRPAISGMGLLNIR